MRGTRCNEKQIIGILKRSDNVVKTPELCRAARRISLLAERDWDDVWRYVATESSATNSTFVPLPLPLCGRSL
jgi:DNA-binding transcriptional regulator PaaX